VIVKNSTVLRPQFYWNNPTTTSVAERLDIHDQELGRLAGWLVWGEVWYPVGGGAGMNFTDTYQYRMPGSAVLPALPRVGASEYTFSDPRNMKGTHEWPLTFRVDNSWMTTPLPPAARKNASRFDTDVGAATEAREGTTKNAEVAKLKLTTHITLDEAPPNIRHSGGDLRQDISTPHASPIHHLRSVHGAIAPTPPAEGVRPKHVYRPDITYLLMASGAGRPWGWPPDPVFYGQLDSEFAGNKPKDKQKIINTCSTVTGHGLQDFHDDPKNKDKNSTSTGFTIRILLRGLARDRHQLRSMPPHRAAHGLSLDYFLKNLINGNYQPTPPTSFWDRSRRTRSPSIR